ncbi:MAG: RDD family protein [Geobacteraceae bacterium]|nr:RDD family protein [Geobacteraceae bacterium]
MSQHGDEYHFSAGTSLIALVVSPFLIALLTAYKPKGKRETSGAIVSLWRRFCAFIIDFYIALLPASAILAIPAILVEWHHTDIFVLKFSREFSRATDVLAAIAPTLLGFAWLLFYFSYPITKGKQTIGQYIMGYRIALKNNDKVSVKKAILRTLFSFFVLCIGWLSIPLAFFHKQKHMLHDNANGLRPEMVSYRNQINPTEEIPNRMQRNILRA